MSTRKKGGTTRVRRAPSKKPPAAARVSLLEAAAACAQKIDPATATVAEIRKLLAKHGHADAPFYADTADFFAELYQNLGEGRLGHVADRAGPLPSGLPRVKAGLLAHLDFSLRHRPLVLLCAKARISFPQVAEVYNQRDAGAALMISVELSAMGWPHPVEGARTVRALLNDVMTVEVLAGGVNPRLREQLIGAASSLAPAAAGTQAHS